MIRTCAFFIFLSLFFNLPTTVFAQMPVYHFSSEIDSVVLFDTSLFRFQNASVALSMIGENRRAVDIRDDQYPNAKWVEPSEADKQFFSNHHPVSAKEYILQQAAKTRIVIFNEAHHQSAHRAYVASLLKPLKALGYTCIGMEGLDYADTTLNERKYPIHTTGYYVNEPAFGNLVRTSCREGLTVFPYEHKYEDPKQKDMNRDLAQAINIKAFMDNHPQAKVIIYCGYDHVIEDSTHNFMVLPMAGQLKRITGIDPFTIDQTELSEYKTVGNVYRKLMHSDTSVIYLDSLGKPFVKSRSKHKKVDCMVYHPNPTNYNFRPGYRITEEKKIIPIAPKISIDFPVLIKVYNSSEDIEKAVPSDVIEMKFKGDSKQIIVDKNGKSKVIVVNQKGQRQELEVE